MAVVVSTDVVVGDVVEEVEENEDVVAVDFLGSVASAKNDDDNDNSNDNDDDDVVVFDNEDDIANRS